jgi:hypothetical protein
MARTDPRAYWFENIKRRYTESILGMPSFKTALST